jgi:hypothetical protein
MPRKHRVQEETLAQQPLLWKKIDVLEGLSTIQVQQLIAAIAELLADAVRSDAGNEEVTDE